MLGVITKILNVFKRNQTRNSNNKDSANLLIISFDQWRGDWGNTNKPIIELPTIQNIAREGLVLENCYTNSPQCVPARFSWLTGLEPSQMGVTKNEDISLPVDAPSNIRELKKLGWHTRIIGKTHWSTHNSGKDIREKEYLIRSLGFENITEITGPRALRFINSQITDDWKNEGVLERQRDDLDYRYRNIREEEAWKSRETVLPKHLYPDIWISEKAKEQIDELPEDKPWICWVSFVGPHEPFDTPKPWRGMTNKEGLPKPIEERKWIKNLSSNCHMKLIEKKWENKLTENMVQELRQDYGDHLRLLDEQTKEIIDKLKKRSDFSNTGIVIMSDHGEMLGDGGMLYKSTFIESSINVPMIYRPPNGISKYTIKEPINLSGIFAIILKGLNKGGVIDPINKWAKKQRGAIVEYAKERVFIKRKKKLCLDYSGDIMWATDIDKDPNELINEADQEGFTDNKEWARIIRWGRRITYLRNKEEWLWRDLIKNKSDQILA